MRSFFIFFFYTQLSKAVILVSFADASVGYADEQEQDKNRRSAIDSDSNRDPLGRHLKILQDWVTDSVSYDSGTTVRLKAKPVTVLQTLGFMLYCFMYIWFTYSASQVYWANALTSTVFQAIQTPNFVTINPLSGEISDLNHFATISTREDVMNFVQQVVPKVMYNSSGGTFAGAENPLKIWNSALPEVYPQLVINHWNIIVGRDKPVRISTRLAKMEQVGTMRVGSDSSLIKSETTKTTEPYMIDRGGGISPNLPEATTLGEILTSTTREVIGRRCLRPNAETVYAFGALGLPGSVEDNGWVCMLDVNANETQAIVDDMAGNDFISAQTATVVVDFVVYNGWADAFVYTAIIFGFQPDGSIHKEISTFTVRLELYGGWDDVPRVCAEVGVCIFTVLYLADTINKIFQPALKIIKRSRSKQQTCKEITMYCCRAVFTNLFDDPFLVIDLVSSIMTIVTMALWYGVVGLDLREFFFSEIPVWSSANAGEMQWKSDAAIIFEFYRAGRALRWFTRVCAINTLFLSARVCKYLQIFPRMCMLFTLFRRGIRDILFFIALMAVVLAGYAMAGHQLFGQELYEFSALTQSIIACFEMFLGTFDYSKMRSNNIIYYALPYLYSYMILFKYMMINMFFAILDKNFREEHLEFEEREKQRKKAARELRQGSSASLGGTKEALTFMARMKKMVYDITGKKAKPAAASPDSMGQHVEDDDMLTTNPSSLSDDLATGVSMGTLGSASITMSDDGEGAKDTGEDQHGDPVETSPEALRENLPKEHNWHYLPPEMQSWALDTAHGICKFVDDQAIKRRALLASKETAGQKKDLDAKMQEAETSIKEHKNNAKKTADELHAKLESKELTSLKEIHQDQESLAWYIMKREAELKKLESMKAQKEERFNKMKEAANALIKNGIIEEEDNGPGLPAITR